MLIAAQMEQIQFVDQAVAFEQIDGAVDGDAMNARVEFLGAIEDSAGVEMALGVVHDFQEDFALPGQSDATLGQRFLQTARAVVGVDSLAGGNSMCGGGHGSVSV